MVKTKITIEEKALLKEYLKKTPSFVIRSKCYALLIRDKGIRVKDIADIVVRDEKTISRWLKEWNEKRMASIFTGHEHNENASKLTKEQKEEIKKALSEPPSAYGIPKEFWDVPALKEYVQTKFAVVYESVQSYHFLLTFSNLSFKYPDTFDRHRDETLIAQRMLEIQAEIKPFLMDKGWEVFASDEVRMELEAFTRRAWLKRGERTIVKVDRERIAQSYIGFLNQKNFNCHLCELDWQNQKEILRALKQFLKKYPKKKICVIWDNAKFHKGKEIKKALGKGQLLERVHLINLPPYAPDKNPIEHVWNTTKGKMANIQYDNFEKMKEVFSKYIDGINFTYDTTDTYDVTCEWDTVTGGPHSQIIHHEVTNHKNSAVNIGVLFDARTKNQITGFNLTGFKGDVSGRVVPSVGDSCPNGGDGIITEVDQISSEGGLYVNYYNDNSVLLQ